MHSRSIQSPIANSSVHAMAMRRDSGYALIALMAFMAVLALMMIAIAPNVRQQAQRERELEAIARGEEVAEAIRLYILEKRTLPTSMDQLVEGLPRGTKKIQILRPYAAVDPLSSSGEWKLVRPREKDLIEFQRKVMLHFNGKQPNTRDQRQVQEVYSGIIQELAGLRNTKSEDEDPAPGGEDESASSSGPFIGVVSRSRRESVIHYYSIDRHDRWIFTPLFRE